MARPLTKEMLGCTTLAGVKMVNIYLLDVSDVGVLAGCESLEVLSASQNSIATMGGIPGTNLAELYLRKNRIANLSELLHLDRMKKLRILCLSDNGCCSHRLYRLFVISRAPSLVRLDNVDVTASERAEAKKTDFAEIHLLIRHQQAKVSALTITNMPESDTVQGQQHKKKLMLSALERRAPNGSAHSNHLLQACAHILNEMERRGDRESLAALQQILLQKLGK